MVDYYPFLVSLLAFLLSLGTALISAYQSHLRDLHDQQAQLSSALGKLQELNLSQIEIHQKYKNTPYETQAATLVTGQLNSTLHTAAQLALQLKTNATTADLAGVALGLYGLGEYAQTEKVLRFALDAAENANDKSVALRYLGFFKIRTGGGGAALKEGESYFEQALNLDREFKLGDQPLVVAWLHANAQLGWASALAPFDCDAAQKHLSEAVTILVSAPSSIDLDQTRTLAKQNWASGIGGVPTCRPASNAVTLQ